ncbi:MAG: hypothetical protein INF44_00415 [Thalassospira sp.]|jgi:hypothetical protein|nr:hypothetical protein [Thalassospira sp.]
MIHVAANGSIEMASKRLKQPTIASLIKGRRESGNPEQQKKALKREAFQKFLESRGLPCCEHLIENTEPPAPDILYKAPSGYIAFELFEVCSPNIAAAQLYDGVSKYIPAWDTYEETLRKKLKKLYASDYPIELLAYTRGMTVSPDDVIIENMLIYIHSANVRFSKVWLMGERFKPYLLYPMQ